MKLFSLLCLVACCADICSAKNKACVLTMNSIAEGTLTSQNYPATYPMSKCVTVINAPTGMNILLTLVDIDTFKSASTCNKKSDKVMVFDKPSAYALTRTWCGATIPSDNTLTSTGNTVKVLFRVHKVGSGYVNTHGGFNISIKFVPGTGITTTPGSTTTGSTTTGSTTTGSTTTASSDTSCGKSKYPNAGSMPLLKVIGGIFALPYEFPWLAVLFDTEMSRSFCGGSILNKRWILTAAHCMNNRNFPQLVDVGVRVHDVNTRAGAQVISVSEIIVHDGFNRDTFNNDIALLKLSQDILYSDDTRPVCLPQADNLYAHRKSVVAGWGNTEDGFPAEMAKYATLNITINADCDAEIRAAHSNSPDVTANMVCASDNAGNTDRDTCQGDSGGPMTVKEADDRFHIVGITSWGYGCASGTPGVYTRVTRYLGWIQSKINN